MNEPWKEKGKEYKMKLSQDYLELVDFLRELLKHLELLLREKQPLTKAEVKILRQLEVELPPGIGLVRELILPRIRYLLKRYGGSSKSGDGATVELSLPKSPETSHGKPADELKKALPRLSTLLLKLREIRQQIHRQSAAVVEIA